ncbi:MAG: insulinase family protein [Acidobacteria bacterium]|nr:insulinase family protein [Acidobacteriota bacterium]
MRHGLVRSALFATALLSGSTLQAQVEDWKQIEKPPLNPFTIPQPAKLVLSNGLTVFLIEDHELPLISLTAQVRTGERDVPADKAGLGDLFGEVWRTGGTTTKTGDQLDDLLEAKAAEVETWMDQDSAGVTLNCLKEDFNTVLAIFAEVLREPAFAEDKIQVAKSQLTTGIARRNDDPGEIVEREATKLGYGADSPYARVPEYSTVAAITRDDLIAWHKKYVHPNRMQIGVAGDFDSKRMIDSLKKTFGSIPKGPIFTDPAPAFSKHPKVGYYFVEKKDVNQASVQMVHIGTTRDNPDFYAIEVVNEIFGGGWASRLFSNVRSKKGLAYHVSGGVGTAYDHPGLFSVSVQTKSQSLGAALDSLFAEIDSIVATPPTTDELKRAKESILNSFVFRFDSKAKVLRQQMTYAFYGYPADFLTRYRAGIERVTIEDVARAAGSYIHRDQLAVLVLGNPGDFDRPLSTFGPVTAVDITIPQPESPKKAAATGDSLALGKTVFAKVVESLGGAEKVAGIKDISYKAAVRIKTPMGQMEAKLAIAMILPDSVRQDVEMPMGKMVMVRSPSGSFMTFGPETQDMPESEAAEMAKEMKRSPIAIAQAIAGGKATINHAGTEKIGDVSAEILDITNDGSEVRLFVDPTNGRILRSAYRSVGEKGPVDNVVDYSDWRDIGGASIAFAESVKENGEESQSAKIEEYKLNAGVDPKLFEKPAPPAQQ